MTTDSVIRRVAQKEVNLFFASPVAWLFLASFSVVTLFIFFWMESFFARNVADVRPLFEWMPLLLIFLCSALTMRMWSDERSSGTLEHVLTQPQGLWRFVLGKFRACSTLLILALICTAPLPLTVGLIADLDWGPVLAGYLATALLGGAYISIGLYVSARTDNPIVSLMGSIIVCGLFYVLGSPVFTGFFGDQLAEILRLMGTGARFENITRGVVDVRDLCYYLSLILIFLSLNIYTLEKERWARAVSTARHRRWRTVAALLVANAVIANVWLAKVTTARVDLTEGNLHSISQPTLGLIEQLREPLLIRGYFSAKTHPLLSPLVPQLRDLISQYQYVGRGNIRAEFIDPARHPKLEREANEQYGITATPFQVADRYQSALVNSYFNVLIRYGDEYETLKFADLIEVKTSVNGSAEVLLRNPEFDISRAIKRVSQRYQLKGDLFGGITAPVEFIAYVSRDELLPERLREYKQAITAQLQEISQYAGGKFSLRFIEPEARDGAVARKIHQEWGFKPMVAALDDDQAFFFYLTLADSHQVVQLPTANFDPTNFRPMLDAGLKRFTKGLTKSVALVVPKIDQQMAQYKLGAPRYSQLETAISKDYSLYLEDLSDGAVTEQADILVVAGPHLLDDTALFAIDQYLMRGGTLILASSPYSAEISGGQIRMQNWSSGLQAWLAHHGITIDQSLVLDSQNSLFPAPVNRQSGGYDFKDVQMIDYPFFIDLREAGLAAGQPATADLPQLTMAWASPISFERSESLRFTTLLRSSSNSWVTDNLQVMPSADEDGKSNFQSSGVRQARTLGIAVTGRFESWFVDKPPLALGMRNLIMRSPESARIVLYASNDFLDDQILAAQAVGNGTAYLAPVQLILNTLEWSLEDDKLLGIRSRGHFNRTLPPMQQTGQQMLEYANYAMAMILLALIALFAWLRKRYRRRHYRRSLSL